MSECAHLELLIWWNSSVEPNQVSLKTGVIWSIYDGFSLKFWISCPSIVKSQYGSVTAGLIDRKEASKIFVNDKWWVKNPEPEKKRKKKKDRRQQGNEEERIYCNDNKRQRLLVTD